MQAETWMVSFDETVQLLYLLFFSSDNNFRSSQLLEAFGSYANWVINIVYG